MNVERSRIVMDYLQIEIEKMQKTAQGLEKMINNKDLKKDNELIESLQEIRSTTLKTIDDKKKKLAVLYNTNIHSDQN
jgi:hypothetical protein